jgi:hypothetical protein
MNRAMTPGGARRTTIAACVMTLATLPSTGCKPKSRAEHTPKGGPSASASTSPHGSSAPSASHSAATATKPPPVHHAPGPTAEAIAEEARAHVTEAVKHAAAKDKCDEILPLLDGSYALVRTSFPLDEHTLGVFAGCAARAHYWGLLRDVAEAIASGERKLETTYFLPRALVGLGEYGKAHALSKATLRAWPKEGEAYNTGALAALRVKDWDGAMKAADQALLLQRKHNVNDGVTAEAHALRGAAVFRMGKTEEGVHEIDAAKGHEEAFRVAGVTMDEAHTAKEKGLLVTVDVPDEAYPALLPLYAKRVAPVPGLVTVVLQNLTDHPMAVTVEAALDGADSASHDETVVKGRPVTVVLTPSWKVGSPLASPKAPEAHEVKVTVTGGADHGTLFHAESKVDLEPDDQMPKVLRVHGEDKRSAFAVEAAWVTPKAAAVAAVVLAAKARIKGGSKEFEGAAGLSMPQAQALWDEVRSRGVSFHRDPAIDREATESETCHLPAETLASGTGNALESSVLFASLLEAIGLDVVLVRTPGHRMVGWVATHADQAASEASASAVKSARGQGFFLETTTVGEGPLDAAVLRGDAAWVAATNDGSVASGRAQMESLTELRKKGITARGE